MNKRISGAAVVVATIIIVTLTGCSIRPFFQPPGERIGLVNGAIIEAGSGKKTPFTIFMYREDDCDYRFYLTVPSHHIRYNVIEDMDVDEGVIRMELTSDRVIEGTLVTEGIEIEGSLEPFISRFKIEL